MYQHIAFLANAEGAVRCLVFHGGIPPAVKVNHVRRRGQIQPRAAGLERKHEERRSVVPLKSFHQLGPFANCSLAVQDQPWPPEDAGKKICQRSRNLAELREDQRLLLPLCQLLADLSEARELSTIVRLITVVAGPLRRVVANLLQPHQRRQHDAAALDSVGLINRRCQLPHRLLVKHRLPPAQSTVGVHLGLLRQIGDHALVGLETAQNIRPHQRAQRTIGIGAACHNRGPRGADLWFAGVRNSFGHLLCQAAKCLGASQQAGIEEVEE